MRQHARHVISALFAIVSMSFALALVAPAAASAGDDYPFRTDTTNRVDPWTFTKRQCVSFAAWRLAQKGQAATVRYWGNARDWNDRAWAANMAVNGRATVGSIAHWNAGERSDTYSATSTRPTGWMRAGSYGHVAVVRAVHRDGTVTVEQYNAGSSVRSYSVKRLKAPRYLHIGTQR